jgi:hypothetical protein
MAFSTYFGAERPFYQLAHNLVLAIPPLAPLRRFGTVAATPENAANALAAGAVLLVYPGGDHEVSRPVWERNVIDVGDFLGHIPLPAKITVQVLPAIDLSERFGPDPDVDEVYEQVVSLMQQSLDELADERRFPVLG